MEQSKRSCGVHWSSVRQAQRRQLDDASAYRRAARLAVELHEAVECAERGSLPWHAIALHLQLVCDELTERLEGEAETFQSLGVAA